MRRKDLRGAHEWIGADVLMSSRMVWRLSARKTEGSCRLVMRSVLDGGVGICNGGIAERSIDIFALDARRDVGRDVGGDEREVGEDKVSEDMVDDLARLLLSHGLVGSSLIMRL